VAARRDAANEVEGALSRDNGAAKRDALGRLMSSPDTRLTGTHVYTWLKCPRAVALDLHGDRAQRRARTDAEELLLQRGRDHETRIVGPLGYPQPEYPERDFAAGARATLRLLQAGVAGVHQGVLSGPRALGIPDLLRKEPGASSLGDWHYVVGDVKSSRRARSDQVLQVAFYSRLLAEAQGRAPEYGYLLLKDGHEERFCLADYGEATDEVLALAGGLLDPEAARAERPFLSIACASCVWSELCTRELEAKDDLSLLQRMTRGLRATLERAGVSDCAGAAAMAVDGIARRTHLEPALLRRLKRAAEARVLREPLPEARGRGSPLPPLAFVHMARDAFEERVLSFALLLAGSASREAVPTSREAELAAFTELVAVVPRGMALAHFGSALPRWYAEASSRRAGAMALERRFLDLAPRLRGAATYPRQVFGLGDYVRCCLGRAPRGDTTGELLDLAELTRKLLEERGVDPSSS
jgi:hypothetical protein